MTTWSGSNTAKEGEGRNPLEEMLDRAFSATFPQVSSVCPIWRGSVRIYSMITRPTSSTQLGAAKCVEDDAGYTKDIQMFSKNASERTNDKTESKRIDRGKPTAGPRTVLSRSTYTKSPVVTTIPPPYHLLYTRSEGLTYSHSYSFALFQLEPPLHPSFQVIRHGRRPVHDGDGPTTCSDLGSLGFNST
jgi:hypothetical protein